MNGKSVPIVNTEMRDGETPLWSHIISDGSAPILSPKTKLIIKRTFMVIWLVYTVLLFWHFSRQPNIDILQSAKDIWPTLIPMIAILTIQWVITRTQFGKNLQQATERRIFQNTFITNQRIIMFNHKSDERAEFEPSDIGEARLDYENGGRALCIRPRKKAKDVILVGTADFEMALNIIHSQFLKEEKPHE